MAEAKQVRAAAKWAAGLHENGNRARSWKECIGAACSKFDVPFDAVLWYLVGVGGKHVDADEMLVAVVHEDGGGISIAVADPETTSVVEVGWGDYFGMTGSARTMDVYDIEDLASPLKKAFQAALKQGEAVGVLG